MELREPIIEDSDFASKTPLIQEAPHYDSVNQDGFFTQAALSIEVRARFVYSYPLQTRQYQDLLYRIEAIASHLSIPVLIEGYDPPQDHRLLISKSHLILV